MTRCLQFSSSPPSGAQILKRKKTNLTMQKILCQIHERPTNIHPKQTIVGKVHFKARGKLKTPIETTFFKETLRPPTTRRKRKRANISSWFNPFWMKISYLGHPFTKTKRFLRKYTLTSKPSIKHQSHTSATFHLEKTN